MAEISIAVYRPLATMSAADREVMRRTLFGCVDGADEDSKRSWKRFWAGVMKAERGEVFYVSTRSPRSGPFHRLHMATEQAVFDAQERFTDFEQFRVWLKVGAGHVDWIPGPRGAVVPVPRSIAYSKLDEDGMYAFHLKVLAFLRESHALKVLWPHLDAKQREDMIETILGGWLND